MLIYEHCVFFWLKFPLFFTSPHHQNFHFASSSKLSPTSSSKLSASWCKRLQCTAFPLPPGTRPRGSSLRTWHLNIFFTAGKKKMFFLGWYENILILFTASKNIFDSFYRSQENILISFTIQERKKHLLPVTPGGQPIEHFMEQAVTRNAHLQKISQIILKYILVWDIQFKSEVQNLLIFWLSFRYQ